MKAVVLAAGYATRLYPLTENKPKCLLEVDGRTILDRLCEKLDAVEGLDEIVIVTNAKFYAQLSDWKKKSKAKKPVRVLNDGTTSNDTRLGAVGDLGLAVREVPIQSDILMLASDNLFDQSLDEFVRSARSKKGASTVAVYDLGDPKLAARKFGVLETEPGTGRVTRMEEKPEHPRSSLIGMGVYYFPETAVRMVGEYLAQKDAQDQPGFLVRWLLGRIPIFAFQFKGLWYDIGDLKALEEANRIFRSSP